MGLSLPTSRLVSLLCATSKARSQCTTTLPPSLVGLGGGFDVPKTKCPPDGGSSDCVTGSPASSAFSANSDSESESNSLQSSLIYPSLESSDYPSYFQHGTTPRPIPRKPMSCRDLATPPLTPDDDTDDSSADGGTALNAHHTNDALGFLLTLFPHNGLSALPYARSVSISAPNMGAAFDGVVLELPGSPKTLYVDGKSAESVSLRESIVALLDLADERLECSALVIALERSSPFLGDLLHSFMYVGGTVVTKPPFQVDPAFVLVGMDI